MKEKLEARIKELNDALEKSAQNHNVLLGALTEVRGLHASLPEEVDNKEAALKEGEIYDVSA